METCPGPVPELLAVSLPGPTQRLPVYSRVLDAAVAHLVARLAQQFHAEAGTARLPDGETDLPACLDALVAKAQNELQGFHECGGA